MIKQLLTLFLSLTILALSAQEKMVGEINIEGLKRTKRKFIIRMIKSKAGKPLDSTIVKEDIERLNRLIGVANAKFVTDTLGDTQYRVTYKIKENFTLIPTINFWTADSLISCHFGLSEFNLFGSGMVLGGFYRHSAYGSYGFNFTAPYLFSKNAGISLNFRDWESKEPLFFDKEMANFRYGNRSIEVMGLFRANYKNKINIGLNLFAERYKFLDGISPLENPEVPQTVKMEKAMLKGVYEFNNLSYFFYLIGGIKNTFNMQLVRTKDYKQQDFIITWNDFIYLRRIKNRGNLATRFRAGIASNYHSPFAPFALDNLINIRGIGNVVQRGSGTLIWNLEYRHTLFEKKWFVLQSNVFTDMGSLRNPGGNFSDFISHEQLKIHTGIGLRFIHKTIYNAIFRIDYGYGLNDNPSQGFVFGVGQYF